MLIEKIYVKVYTEMEKEIQKDDYKMGDSLTILIRQADLEVITQEELADLMCKASAIGQKCGFVSGFRFVMKLIGEILN